MQSLRIPVLALACALAAGCATTRTEEPAALGGTQTAHAVDTKTVETATLRYLLHLPEGYDAESDKRWPTILFLHGAGERGDDLDKVTVHGPPKLAKNDPKFPFIVISPQCPTGERWHVGQLTALLDKVSKDYAVDEKRVYLTGLSMGGYGSWALGAAHAERFAAIAPICGGGATIDVRLARRVENHPLKSLPVWAFHGGKDSVVPVWESERMIEAFKAIGNKNVKLTIYPEANHDSWTATYDNPEFFEWLLSHSND